MRYMKFLSYLHVDICCHRGTAYDLTLDTKIELIILLRYYFGDRAKSAWRKFLKPFLFSYNLESHFCFYSQVKINFLCFHSCLIFGCYHCTLSDHILLKECL